MLEQSYVIPTGDAACVPLYLIGNSSSPNLGAAPTSLQEPQLSLSVL